MIICTKCGMHNIDTDTFCGQCGSFLEWAGEKVAPEPAPVVPVSSQVQADQRKEGVVERVKSAMGRDAKPASNPEPPPPAASMLATPLDTTPPPPSDTAPLDPAATTAADGPPPTTEQDAGDERARRAEALLAKPVARAPLAEPSDVGKPEVNGGPPAAIPAARQPEAVKPAKPVNRPMPRPAGPRARSVKAGDLICGQCGEGNDPKRNFCHHCGVSLKEAVVVTVPWWRRLFQRRPKEPVAAGTRPTGGRTTGNQRGKPNVAQIGKRLMAVVVIVVGLIAIAAPSVRRSIPRSFSAAVRKFVYHYAPISVSRVDAMGNEVPGHAAANVFQGEANSFWAAPAPKLGTKPRVRVFFDRPHDVALLRITSGDPANFPGSPRPKVMEYQFSDGKTHKPLQIENVDTPQKFKVSAPKATYVDIVIDDVYPVAGSPFYSAVSRIEAFQKKAGK